MLAKTRSYSIFGLLNLSPTAKSIADFNVARYTKIANAGNIEPIGKRQCQIPIQRTKITM